MQKLTTFLMFVGAQCGKAEEAMRFYTSLFPNSGTESIEYLTAAEAGGQAGLVKKATFTLDGQEFIANDSPAPHHFTFTPSISIFVSCENESDQTRLYDSLRDGGELLMPIDNYGFSKRFAWVADRYGVSWQLNLD